MQSCKQDINTFLCLYRAKEDNGCDVNKASNQHAANVLKASSFVLACERAVCVHSPYSLKSRGGSHLKTPARRAILQWILDYWAELPADVIKKSLTTCALNLLVDGSRDDNIHCLKEGQPCSSGKPMLKSQLGILSEPETNPFECTDSDVEDACPTLQLLDSDHDEDSDVEIEV